LIRLRLPPGATLFPYTTLFRSGRDPELVVVSPDGGTLFVSNEEIAHASGVDVQTGRIKFSTQVGVEPEGIAVSPDGSKVYVTAEDRKSTRLNSSHQIISYAVFC